MGEQNEILLEHIAEAVHDAWWEQSRKAGRHAPADCPEDTQKVHPSMPRRHRPHCDKCHPDMIPYADLSEPAKEYDRVTARAVLAAIGDETADLRAQLAEVTAEKDAALSALRECEESYALAISDESPLADSAKEVLRGFFAGVPDKINAALAQQPATQRAEAERAVIAAARREARNHLARSAMPPIPCSCRLCLAVAALDARGEG